MKQKGMLWMYGFFLFSLLLLTVSAYPLEINNCRAISIQNNLSFNGNGTGTLNGNVTLVCDFSNIFENTSVNVTDNYTSPMMIYYSNQTNRLYLMPFNATAVIILNNSYYTKNESDNIFLLRTDFVNWKTLEQPSLYLKKTDVNFSDLSDSITKMQGNLTDVNSKLDDNSFSSLWKILLVGTLFLSLIAIGIGIKTMIG